MQFEIGFDPMENLGLEFNHDGKEGFDAADPDDGRQTAGAARSAL